MGDDPPARRVGLFGMVVMGFFWVCGGMYGNEELLGTAPPALVLLALIVVPCCHSLPVSMMIAECGTAWPADGGLPVFVQHAFGDTIGGHNTFFTWLNCLVDAAIYPVMAASYTRELLGHYQVVVDERLTCIVIVILMTAVQLRGLDWMVRFSTLLLLLSLGPTVLFALLGAPQLDVATLSRSAGPRNAPLLLSFVFWLDSGFYSLADIAGEVEDAGRVLPMACAILQPLNMLVNLLPLAVALSLDADPAHYAAGTGYFSSLATRAGGWWLGKLFFVASMVSNLGNYASQTVSAEKLCSFFLESQLGFPASGSRPPPCLAPGAPCSAVPSARLGRYLCLYSDAAGQLPWIIVFNAACILALILLFPLDMLIELVALIMTVNMSLFLLAFVQLRRAEPHTPRPFRMPGGRVALCLAVASPLLFILANLVILLLEPAHGAARLVFLCATVGAGSLMQALYRRATATRADDARARLERAAPSAQAAAADAAARRLMQALAVFLGLACLLVGGADLVRGGPPPPAPPPPPPPPPPPFAQWRAAAFAGKPEPSRGTHGAKVPKAPKTPKAPKAPKEARRRPTAHPRDHHNHKTNRQGNPKAGAKEKSAPRGQPPYEAAGQAKPQRARKRGEPAIAAV